MHAGELWPLPSADRTQAERRRGAKATSLDGLTQLQPWSQPASCSALGPRKLHSFVGREGLVFTLPAHPWVRHMCMEMLDWVPLVAIVVRSGDKLDRSFRRGHCFDEHSDG